MGQRRSDTNFVAARITSSVDFTKTGNFRQPGDLKMRTNNLSVSCNRKGTLTLTSTNHLYRYMFIIGL